MQRLHLQVEAARELDQIDHRAGEVDIARLEDARGDLHRGVRRGRPTVGCVKEPSAPRCKEPSGGATSLMRATIALVSGVWPSGTIEMVPSPATVIVVAGGMLIGPPSPIT